MLRMPNKTDWLGATATILGGVGAVLAAVNIQRRLSMENERLKDSLLRWRVLTVLASVVGAAGWLT